MNLFNKARNYLNYLAQAHSKCLGIALTTGFKHLIMYDPTKTPEVIETIPDTKKDTDEEKKPLSVSRLFDSCEYICLVCRKRFTTSKGWRRHITAQHQEDVSFLSALRCDVCRLAFARPN